MAHDHETYPANSAGVQGLYQGFQHVAPKAHDTPGIYCFESYDASGDIVTRYVWLDSNGNLRHASSIPSNQDTAGQIFGLAYGQIQVKKLDVTADVGGATETDTKWDLPNPSIVLPFPWVKVTTLDAGITIDVGTNGAGSDDPNGFLDGVSVATAGLVKGTLVSTGQTLGALLRVDEDGSGTVVPEPALISGVASVTWTPSAACTWRGSIYIPYIDMS